MTTPPLNPEAIRRQFEDAPHGWPCGSLGRTVSCNCWKSTFPLGAILERLAAAEAPPPASSDALWCGIQNGVVECEKRYLLERISELEAALAEARKDTERLDWLIDAVVPERDS
jgi:hypothetical protein